MSNRRLLLLGASGQLGSELSARLGRRPDFDLTPATHGDLDLLDVPKLKSIFGAVSPWAVINCVAYNQVDGAESEAKAAFDLNCSSLSPLAALCRTAGSLLVHFSTDYVFDGKASIPYTEDVPASPVNVYGLSKSAGEALLRFQNPRTCIVRTCGVYGRARSPRGKVNFIDSILAQAKSGRTPEVIDNLRCTPTSAADLAEAVEALVDLEAVGTYHATNSGDCTWHEFAEFGLAAARVGCRPRPVGFSRQAGKAERPSYSVLSNTKLNSSLHRPMASWQDALARYVRHIET